MDERARDQNRKVNVKESDGDAISIRLLNKANIFRLSFLLELHIPLTLLKEKRRRRQQQQQRP